MAGASRTPVPPSVVGWRLPARLVTAFGPGGEPATAAAPGRCTLVGEHVDYAGGLVLCVAIDLHVVVALRPVAGRRDRVLVADGVAERSEVLRPAGGGYVFAAADALRARGFDIPAFEAATAASLPAGAGLASSAAVICATLVALLRQQGARLSAADLVDAAYDAEHGILGVASGRLDEHAVVQAPAGGALLVDSARDRVEALPWAAGGVALCICDTGERHRVAGDEYRVRRKETEAALRDAHAASAQELAFGGAGAAEGIDLTAVGAGDVRARRLRHVVSETRRAAAAAEALRAGDAPALGRLMSASHRSLRDDHQVSTATLDAVVAAAQAVGGCHGARMVGAGFGGSVVALADATAAAECSDAMCRAAGDEAASWVVHPSGGLADTAGDAVVRG